MGKGGQPLNRARKLQNLSKERDLTEDEACELSGLLERLGLPQDHQLSRPTRPALYPRKADKPDETPPEPAEPAWKSVNVRALLPRKHEKSLAQETYDELEYSTQRAGVIDRILAELVGEGTSVLDDIILKLSSEGMLFSLAEVHEWLENDVDDFKTRAEQAEKMYQAGIMRIVNDKARKSGEISKHALSAQFYKRPEAPVPDDPDSKPPKFMDFMTSLGAELMQEQEQRQEQPA